MASTSTTETWNAAWTLSLRAHRKRLTDNFFDSYPTLAAMRIDMASWSYTCTD